MNKFNCTTKLNRMKLIDYGYHLSKVLCKVTYCTSQENSIKMVKQLEIEYLLSIKKLKFHY